jgi:hypothetical protein
MFTIAQIWLYLVLVMTIDKTLAFKTSPESMCCRVNEERARYSLPPLGVLPELNAAAQVHANMQSNMQLVFHITPDGSSTPMSRITASGLTDWIEVLENAGGQFDKESEIMRAWIGSPGHHQAILAPATSCMGSAEFNGYWTQEFAQIPNAESRCARPRCKYNGGRLLARLDDENAVLDDLQGKIAKAQAQLSTSFKFKLTSENEIQA